MTKIILQDCFVGDFPTTQVFGVNYDSYKWILDINGKPIGGHNGWDVGTPNGTRLINPFPKSDEVVVSYVGWDPQGYGNFLRMWNKTQRFVILYAHAEKIVVQAGQKLSYQQLVAVSDNTGWSTGPHCHIAGYYVDEEGNRLNRDNGFDGWVDILNKDIVTWNIKNPTEPGTTTQTSITIPGELYEHLVEGSTVRKDVAGYLGFSDPDNTPFKDIQATIAGFKSSITTLQTNLSTAQAEVKNREEQVERIQQTADESARQAIARQDELEKTIEAKDVTIGSLEKRVTTVLGQVDSLSKEKGALNIIIATLQTENKKLKDNAASSLGITDALAIIKRRLFPFLHS